MENSGIKT